MNPDGGPAPWCRGRAAAGGSIPPQRLRSNQENDALVGKYYGGPTWEHADGSKVTGKQLAAAPAPTAGNVPWQLVQATPSRGSMTMNGISYVQQINTVGGVAPAEPCTAAASKKQVRYAADYRFYKG